MTAPRSSLRLPNVDHQIEDACDNNVVRTPELDYFTPAGAFTASQETAAVPYRSRTLPLMDAARCSVLPMFLPSPSSQQSTLVTFDVSTGDENQSSPFLLANVPGMPVSDETRRLRSYHHGFAFYSEHQLSVTQLARRRQDAYGTTFQLISNETDAWSNSFILSTYQQLLLDLSARWHINVSVLDFNLARLRRCATQWREQLQRLTDRAANVDNRTGPLTTFTLEELPLAIEFYLQMDGTST